MARSLNIYVPDQDEAIVRRFMRRLKRQRISLSLWVCRAVRMEEEKSAAVDKMLEIKPEETV